MFQQKPVQQKSKRYAGINSKLVNDHFGNIPVRVAHNVGRHKSVDHRQYKRIYKICKDQYLKIMRLAFK
jgi:hypothetical protein